MVPVLGLLGRLFGALGGVLERLGRVCGRLGAENKPSERRSCYARFQDRRSGGPQGADNIKRRRKSSERKHTENLRDSADQVTADADTQLGAFGPGADPKRRRAASPPPRLDRDSGQNLIN